MKNTVMHYYSFNYSFMRIIHFIPGRKGNRKRIYFVPLLLVADAFEPWFGDQKTSEDFSQMLYVSTMVDQY